MKTKKLYTFCKNKIFPFDSKSKKITKQNKNDDEKVLKLKNLQLRKGELSFTMLN